MTRRLVILYEDSRGPFQRFPLHDLVVKSAADLVQFDVHELLHRVFEVPKKGVTKVLDDVGSGRFTQRGEHFLVWVDNDRIRRALQLAPRCARETVIATIKARAPQIGVGARPKPVEVFLLDDNLEDLLSRYRGSAGPSAARQSESEAAGRARRSPR